MIPTPWRAGLFNREWERGYLIWCRRRDLNPHGLRHTPLKRACLPFHHFGTWQELEKPPQLRSRVAQPSTYSAVGLGISLAAALLQGFLKLLQLEILEQTVTLFRACVSRLTLHERRS